MPSWLVDDPSTVYLLLGVAALALAAGWWMTRDRRFAIGLGCVVVLFLIVLLLSRLIDTDAKKIKRAIEEMSEGVKVRSAERIFAHVSDGFDLGNAGKKLGKKEFRAVVEHYLKTGLVTEMKVWDYEPGTIDPAKRDATVFFRVKGQGAANFGYEFFNCKAVFTLDPDGQWRMRNFQLFAPQTAPNDKDALVLPF